MGIYNQNILRINLNELVQTRASLQGKNLTTEEADDYANKLRRQLNWDSMFEQIDEFIKNTDKEFFKEVTDHLEGQRAKFTLEPIKVTSTPEDIEKGAPENWEIPITFDQSNFFA